MKQSKNLFNPLDYPSILDEPSRLTDITSWHEHIPFAFWIVAILQPKTFVELGTHKGDSYGAFCQAVAQLGLSTKCYAVDTWKGDEHAGFYEEDVFTEFKTYHDQQYGQFSQLIRSTFDEALEHFSGGSIDLLHIDGLHTYNAVRHDLDCWLPKMSRKGVILLHDTNVHERGFGVWKLWKELKEQFPSFEFTHGHGLGILMTGKMAPEKLEALLAPRKEVKENVRRLFYLLGNRVALQRNNDQLQQTLAERDGKITALTQEHERTAAWAKSLDQELAGLRSKYAGLASEHETQGQWVKQLDTELNTTRERLGALTQEHERATAWAKTLDAELATSRQRLAEFNSEITNLNRTVTHRDAQIAILNQAVAERDGQVANLNQAVAERNGQISTLSTELSSAKNDAERRQAHIEELRSTVSERDGQIADLQKAVAERDGQIAVLNGVVLQRDEILASTSWRLTKPLRIVGQKLKNAAHVWRLLPRILRIGGGLRGTSIKAFRVMCCEGLDGIKRRIAYAATGRFPLLRSPAPSTESPSFQSYDEWIRRYDTLTDGARAQIKQIIENLASKPIISVVMPVYNPKPEWLQEAIESVRSQLYPHWELCMADDASDDPRISEILNRYASNDSRIKVYFRKNNGHISVASNSALMMATGKYVALMDHDDRLHPLALYFVAKSILDHPQAEIIYSDEDKIEESNSTARYDPYFKCDFNYDLFLSQNMISHLGCYRRERIEQIGGFREAFEGSQDYDLALRILEHIRREDIIHIPRVLYHWRATQGSTALEGDKKPYAKLAAQRAIKEHLCRRGVQADVVEAPEAPGMQRVRYAVPVPHPSVCIIVPTRDKSDLLELCINSIFSRTTYRNYSICIVDNGSKQPETFRFFDRLPKDQVCVLRDDRPFNFSALNNTTVAATRSDFVCLMNNDIEVLTADWLEEMIGHAARSNAGAVGARLWYPDEKLQHGGVILVGGVAGHAHKFMPRGDKGYFFRGVLQQEFSAVTAACLLIRRAIYEEVGGFDESLTIAFNDVDFCLRVGKRGYHNVWTPYAEFIHHESASRGHETTPEKQSRFQTETKFMKARWGGLLTNDPAYSPNLNLDREDFSWAWPPRVSMN